MNANWTLIEKKTDYSKLDILGKIMIPLSINNLVIAMLLLWHAVDEINELDKINQEWNCWRIFKIIWRIPGENWRTVKHNIYQPNDAIPIPKNNSREWRTSESQKNLKRHQKTNSPNLKIFLFLNCLIMEW